MTLEQASQNKYSFEMLFIYAGTKHNMIKKLFTQLFKRPVITPHYPTPLSVVSPEFASYVKEYQERGLSKQLLEHHRKHYIDGLPTATNTRHESSLHFYRLASFNRDGYVREHALKCLIQYINPESIPFILLRLNDYVEAVRNRALAVLPQLLKAEYNAALLDNFSLIHNLQNQKHTQTHKAYQQILDFLLQDSSTRLHIPNVNNRARILIAKTFIKANYDRQYLIEWFLHDPLFVIRQKALPFYDALPREKFLSLLNDPAFAIRKAMLYWLNDHGTNEEKNKYYKEKLLDQSRTVRQLAQFYTKQTGFDLINFYQQAFKNGYIEQSILGLLDLNDGSLISEVKPYLENTNTQEQIAAFLYLSHCDGSDLYHWILDHLADDYSRLQKHLLDYLADYINDEVEHKLTTLLSESSLDVTQRRVLRVLIKFRSINALKICLQLTVEGSEPVKSLAKQLIINKLKVLKYGTHLNQEHMDKILKIIANFLQQYETTQQDDHFIDFLKKF